MSDFSVEYTEPENNENSPSGCVASHHSHSLVSAAMNQGKRGVFARLIAAREELQRTPIRKTGYNKFAEYSYFELSDFLPDIQRLFQKWGLVDVISFTEVMATMKVFDVIDGSSVEFTSPMAGATLKNCHPIQNLGAVETYQRKYLYITAMAIIENDNLDSSTGDPRNQNIPQQPQPNPATPNLQSKLFIEELIELAQASEGLTDLTDLWKRNQDRIDQIKAEEKNLFIGLRKAFAVLKKQFAPSTGEPNE